MRMILAGLAMLALSGCIYDADHAPPPPGTPGGQVPTTQGLPPAQGPVAGYDKNKPPTTPYEIRRAEIDRDKQIAGKGDTYPPLFKDQKDSQKDD